jgi:hypothetical protein
MNSISRVLTSIKPSEWKHELGDISYWTFEKLPPQVSSPTCVFTIRARVNSSMLPGFEKVYAEWNVDQVDLGKKEFIEQSDPESAYMNFVKGNFAVFMSDAAKKIAKNAALKAGIILPKKANPLIVDKKHQGQMDKFNNLLHSYQQRKNRYGV